MRMNYSLLLLLGLLGPAAFADAQRERPLLGAQVWIEPGQTSTEIDACFARLEAARMPVARLFIMWSYIETAPDAWDYSLYDTAFRAAERHHVRVVATLTPSGPPPFRHGDGSQGGGVIGNLEDRAEASVYIGKIVDRYKTSPALDTWLLTNEPGQEPGVQPLTVAGYREFLAHRYENISALNGSWHTAYQTFGQVAPGVHEGNWNAASGIDWSDYWRDYQTAWLQWIADEVKRHDRAHPLHLNPAGLVGNLTSLSDDLPAWRTTVDTLGCSIHPGWHFSLLRRDRFALGVSYINDLVAGAIEPKPYWVTELQGGNNISSAMRPMDPDAADIAQWVWTSVGAGAERVIFWLLNARRAGTEAAEWSLLDFEQQPSIRLETAARIARTIDDHAAFFAGSRPVESPVTVILSLDTMTLQQHYAKGDQPGRSGQAHVIETLGLYEALSQLGVPPRVKHFDDYDWTAKSASPRMAVLGDVRAITAGQISKLEAFVAKGNTLLITGLSGFYDPHAKAWPLAGFPLQRVTGARWKEVHYLGEQIEVPLHSPWPTLEARLWRSSVTPVDASALGEKDGETTATDRKLSGGGRVLWVPELIGQGAWFGDPAPLVEFLRRIVPPADGFALANAHPGCLLRVLRHGQAAVTVVTNGTQAPNTCVLQVPDKGRATALWGDAPSASSGQASFALDAKGTAVMLWR